MGNGGSAEAGTSGEDSNKGKNAGSSTIVKPASPPGSSSSVNTADQKKLERAKETGLLSIAHRELTEVPVSIFEISHLSSLDFASNFLKSIPEAVSRFTALNNLDVTCNDFTTAPLFLTSLESLVMGHNDLANLSKDIIQLRKLTRLDVKYNKLQLLPPMASTLRVLDVSYNNIDLLPDQLGTLRDLLASSNALIALPDLEHQNQLATLDVSNNHITLLPQSMGLLRSLTLLNLSGNKIAQLPASISRLTLLKELALRDNILSQTPGDWRLLQSVTRLDLCHNRLTSLPAGLLYMRSLLYLNLNSNQLRNFDIPDDLTAYNIRELGLGDNLLSELPPSLRLLSALRVLYLGYNNLASVSLSFVSNMPQLGLLSLSGNNMTELTAPTPLAPDSTGLRELYLAANNLKTLPDKVLELMKFVRVLDLRSNPLLSALPKTLLPKLTAVALVDISDTAVPDTDDVLLRLKADQQKALQSLKSTDPGAVKPQLRVGKPPAVASVLGVCDTIGRREQMEDEVSFQLELGGRPDWHYFAVYDGHGGRLCCTLLHQNLGKLLTKHLTSDKARDNIPAALRDAVTDMTSILEDHMGKKVMEATGQVPEQSGATACVCVLLGETLYIINMGDARAVLARGSTAIRLSEDHKPSGWAEERRVRKVGGFVTAEGRVLGRLAVSRAFGDLEMRPFISDSPDITKHDLQPEDHFVILACDGIWDVTSDRMAVSLCRPHVDESCDFAALKLRDHAYFAGSQDNISVLIFSLKALRAAQQSGTMPKT